MDHYLAQMERFLASVPPDVREGACQEMRQHLMECLAAHIELGTEPDEAMAAALRQFGKAERIAHRFERAWAETELKALCVGRLPRWITSMAVLWFLSLLMAMMLSGQQPITRDIPTLAPLLYCLSPLFLLALPIACGMAVGRNRSPVIGRYFFNGALIIGAALTLLVFAISVMTSDSVVHGLAFAAQHSGMLGLWILGWALAAVARRRAQQGIAR